MPACWGCCHVHLVKATTTPVHFSSPKRCEKGTEIWKYREGAAWRAGVPATGHQLHPTAVVGDPDPSFHCCAPALPGCLWPPALGPFALSREQLLWPQAAPICPAFAQGHSLPELGFPLASPQHTLNFSFPAIAGWLSHQQPAMAPVKGCWTLCKFLEGQKYHLSSRLSLMGGETWLTGRGTSLPWMGCSNSSVDPPTFWESKWPGKQHFNIFATHKDAKGCQEARFQLGAKTSRAAACGLCNVTRGLWEGCAGPPCAGC